MTLQVTHPANYARERAYIIGLLLSEFLGIELTLAEHQGSDVIITADEDSSGRRLAVADGLFQTPQAQWLTQSSLPQSPLERMALGDDFEGVIPTADEIPVVYGRRLSNGEFRWDDDSGTRLGVDIFGSAFFMLTRYEEVVCPTRDSHGRFPASASLAAREGFLERPIVNEYVEVLWAAIKALWPNISRKPRKSRVLVSHDVDNPFATCGAPLANIIKSFAGDLTRRRDPNLAVRRLLSAVRTSINQAQSDINYTFPAIMELAELCGRPDAFYFFADRTSHEVDGRFTTSHPEIRKLMAATCERGHEIGLHTSYNTYQDSDQTARELALLRDACRGLGIEQEVWGGRQHYLRWENPTTWQNWEDAGLAYDSTVGFADAVGFRCGVCYEYPVFNLKTRRVLRLRERPLVAMEVSLLGYMGCDLGVGLAKLLELYEVCRAYSGDFTLLWHNDNLVRAVDMQAYRALMDALAGVNSGSNG